MLISSSLSSSLNDNLRNVCFPGRLVCTTPPTHPPLLPPLLPPRLFLFPPLLSLVDCKVILFSSPHLNPSRGFRELASPEKEVEGGQDPEPTEALAR